MKDEKKKNKIKNFDNSNDLIEFDSKVFSPNNIYRSVSEIFIDSTRELRLNNNGMYSLCPMTVEKSPIKEEQAIIIQKLADILVKFKILEQKYNEAYFDGCLFGYEMANNFIEMYEEDGIEKIKEIINFQIEGIKNLKKKYEYKQ